MTDQSLPLLSITPFYAGILGLIYTFLAFAIIRVRMRERLALGDGNLPGLQRKIRAHANFNEYTPIILLLIVFIELQHGAPFLIHLFSSSLLIGRAMHAWSVSNEQENLNYRMVSMILTFIPLIGASLVLLVLR